jgi:hypothetical protein
MWNARRVRVWVLTGTDCDRTTVEQDGAWRYGQGPVVKWEGVYKCVTLYSAEAWNGINDTRLEGISWHTDVTRAPVPSETCEIVC